MKYVCYARKSKLDDSPDVLSIEMQFESMKPLIEGKEALFFAETGLKGDSDINKRPELKAAMAELKGGDVFVVWKMNRVFRSLIKGLLFCEEIDKRKASITSIMEPGFFDDPTVRNIRLVLAEHQLKEIRENVKSALRTKKNRGERVGYIPYGYMLAEDPQMILKAIPDYEEAKKAIKRIKIVANPAEQEVLRVMRDLYIVEGLAYHELPPRLEALGLPNREGRPWSRSSVHRTLTRAPRHAAFYLGQGSAGHAQ